MSKDRLKKVSKAHIRYKTADGKVVPGATTITGLLNKPYLIKWANMLGLEGIDSSKYTDEAASTGTLAHAMIQADLDGTEIDREQFSPLQVSLAENAVLSWFEWKKHHDIKPLLCEQAFVVDTMENPFLEDMPGYGGTVDCYCMLDGKYTLLDFKTSKSIYPEYFVQLAAYKNLLEKHGKPVDQVRILRVGRDENEGFEERSVPELRWYWIIFQCLLIIYYAKKKAGWTQ